MDKQAVARQFSSAAHSYDDVAYLQRAVADELMHLTKPLAPKDIECIADLGTGTGYCLPFLQSFQPEKLYGVDLSSAMLDLAQQRVPSMTPVEADLESVPLAENSQSLLFSSLAVQWLDHPAAFVAHAAKLLKPNGVLAIATLGPNTLWELKRAWQRVDDDKHVNSFHHAVDWIEAIWQTDLTLQVWREKRIEVRYQEPMALLRELKTLGANHVDRDVAPKMASVRKMICAYQAFQRSDGHYPATWDVHYLIARKA